MASIRCGEGHDSKDVPSSNSVDENVCCKHKVCKINNLIIDICSVTSVNKKEKDPYVRAYLDTLSKVFSIQENVRKIVNFALLDKNTIHFNPEKGFFGPGWEMIKLTPEGKYLQKWHEFQKQELDIFINKIKSKKIDEYKEFGNGILLGVIGGFLLGKSVDSFGLEKNVFAESATRFVTGNSDTIGGIGQRILNRLKKDKKFSEISTIDYFAIGGALGMTMGPIMHTLIKQIAENPSGVAGTLYASAYSTGDNTIGGGCVLNGYIKKFGLKKGLKQFGNDPFQMTNALVIISALLLNIIFRSFVDNPITNQTLAAIEGNLLNLDSLIAVGVIRMYERKYINDFEKIISSETVLSKLKTESAQ